MKTTAKKVLKHAVMSIVCLILFAAKGIAQNCDCTVKEVQSNTVMACNKTVGTVVNVSNATDLRNAIIQANAIGGNTTILIANGTYQIASTSWYPYITGNNVVLRSLSGKRDSVILRGGGMMPTGSTENVFGIAGNNVTIADLTISDCGNHGIQVSGANLYVHNVHFKNTYEQMLKGATGAATIDSAIVQCSLFEYTAGVGPNYYIGGLDIHKGTNWLVRDNVFRNIESPSGSVAEHAIHFWNSSANNTIERNLIINCDRGIGFGLGSSPVSGGIIRNNMIYNDGTGLFSDVGIALETSPNTRIYNNTVYVAYQNAIEYRFAATTNVDIKNNLCNKAILSRDAGSATLATNITNAQASWFVNVSTGDLHLASAVSSVVNTGTNLSAYVSDDIDKTTRPQGSGFDIGADEYYSGGSIWDKSHRSQQLLIYPNPSASGIFSVQRSTEVLIDNCEISVLDFLGKTANVTINTGQQSILELDLSRNPKGIFLLTINDGSMIYQRKIVFL